MLTIWQDLFLDELAREKILVGREARQRFLKCMIFRENSNGDGLRVQLGLRDTRDVANRTVILDRTIIRQT